MGKFGCDWCAVCGVDVGVGYMAQFELLFHFRIGNASTEGFSGKRKKSDFGLGSPA